MLTDLQIKRIKGRADSDRKISDGGGLHLLVKPSGALLWRLAYRYRGRQKTLAFGRYPDVSLTAARDQRDDAKRMLRLGTDPGAKVRADKLAVIAAVQNTFAAVAEEWIERKLVKQERSASTVDRARWLLRILNASLGTRALAEIEPPELLAVLRRIEAADQFETVARLRSAASSVFRYGIATGRCSRDIAADLRGALTSPTSTPHAAITDPNGIGELLRAIDGYRRSTVMRLALRFLALVFVRPGEVRFAQWSEIAGNVWNIPGERMKMRTPHRVPLSRQALDVLNELRTLPGGSRYLFASTNDQPFGESGLNDALKHLGYAPDEMTPHGSARWRRPR